MYLLKGKTEDLFAMSKLTYKRAANTIKPYVPEFLYFSPVSAGHGPRIKFYGGTAYTDTTDTSPSFTITQYGAGKLVIQSWMNKSNCPNAFNNKVLTQIKKFINMYYPLLLLVWFKHLDESDLLAYFEGRDDWNTVISNIDVDTTILQDILKCETTVELDKICKRYQLYTFNNEGS